MGIFASSSASFQPVINEVVNAADRQQFVGGQILPILQTRTQIGKYVKVEASEFDNDVSKPRAAGSNFANVTGEITSATYECEEYGVESILDDLTVAQLETDALYDSVAAVANRLADDLSVGHELRVAAALSGASFTSTAAAAVMSDTSNAKPINDVQAAVRRLHGNGIFENINLVMEESLYQEMLQTDDMRNLINGSGTLAFATDQVARVLGVDGVILCKTKYNSAMKGQTASRADIWPTDAYYVASIVGGSLSGGGIGRTMAYSARGGAFVSETFRTEQPPANVIRVRQNTDELITNANAGQKVTGA